MGVLEGVGVEELMDGVVLCLILIGCVKKFIAATVSMKWKQVYPKNNRYFSRVVSAL